MFLLYNYNGGEYMKNENEEIEKISIDDEGVDFIDDEKDYFIFNDKDDLGNIIDRKSVV